MAGLGDFQVATARQGSQTSSELGRATVLAAADQLRESQQEAQQLAAALQVAQAEARYSLMPSMTCFLMFLWPSTLKHTITNFTAESESIFV